MQSHEKKAGLGSPLSTSSKSAAGRAGAGEDVGDSDDYVNASYVQPLGTKKKYIATQGPLPETFVDFWTYVSFSFFFFLWRQPSSCPLFSSRNGQLVSGLVVSAPQLWLVGLVFSSVLIAVRIRYIGYRNASMLPGLWLTAHARTDNLVQSYHTSLTLNFLSLLNLGADMPSLYSV